jgi:hypothetical protein
MDLIPGDSDDGLVTCRSVGGAHFDGTAEEVEFGD